MVEYLLGAIYLIGVFFASYFVYKKLEKKNKDGDPQGLDFLTAFGAGVFWPLVMPIYVLFVVMSI